MKYIINKMHAQLPEVFIRLQVFLSAYLAEAARHHCITVEAVLIFSFLTVAHIKNSRNIQKLIWLQYIPCAQFYHDEDIGFTVNKGKIFCIHYTGGISSVRTSFLLLESGRADAFVMDGQILAGNISKSKNPAGFKIVGEVLSVEPIACMVRKDDPAFLKAVDDSIKRQIADGSLAKLYDKWFMQPIPPTNTKVGLPLSEATKAAWANPNNKPMEDYAKK